MTVDATSERILVLAPRGRDAELTCEMLAKVGHACVPCRDGHALIAQIKEGAACAIVTQEALAPGVQRDLARLLDAQPPWSDFPLILLAGHSHVPLGVDLGNVTVLERPVSPQTLLTAVRSAYRARKRQYEGRAAIQQRDQFLAMLGHELRNPLAAIVLASEPNRPRTTEQSIAHLQMISRQAGHLTRLVDDLLDVARVTSGKVRLQREAVDTVAVVASCIGAHSERAREHGITLVTAQGPSTLIEADPVRLEQIINNLIGNAIKYSPAGTKVTITTAVDDGHWELRVRDQGVGISAEMLPRVFDLFAQAESTLARAEGGMGIGLTLVDRLVRLHNGTVGVVSAGEGKGSEFIVRIPVGNAKRVQAEQPEGIAGAAINVVLVEDNVDLREVSKSMLESLGCLVEVAGDGLEGVAKILEAKPVLAIVDIGLPGLDGFGVARQVRATLGSSLVLVAVTGYGQQNDREQAIASGFDLHITKPLKAAAMRSMIDRARTLAKSA